MSARPKSRRSTRARNRLPRIDYAAYLESEHWQELRQQVIERDGWHCRRCHRPDYVQVHHLTYARLGRERLDDLVSLCKDCHERTHADGWKPWQPPTPGQLKQLELLAAKLGWAVPKVRSRKSAGRQLARYSRECAKRKKQQPPRV